MNVLKKINRPTRQVLAVALLLILYGYLCRAVHLYFFWESLTVGWELLLVGLIILLFGLIKQKKRAGRKYIWEGIGAGLLIFYIIVQVILYIALMNSDAYQAARTWLSHNDAIRAETGNIDRMVLIPAGQFSGSSNARGTAGSATIEILIKGDKKFKDLTLYLDKQVDTDWKVEYIQ